MGKFYKRFFKIIMWSYLLQILFYLCVYVDISGKIPIHFGIMGVDEVSHNKLYVFTMPAVFMFTTYILQPKFVDNRYPVGSVINWLLKVGFIILQIIIALSSFYFLFYICNNDL